MPSPESGSHISDARREALRTLLREVGEVRAVEPLTGGTFATTYRVDLTDGRTVVVKTAPTATDRLLTCELGVLRSEAEVYGLAAGHPELLMPEVLHTDFSRSVLPGDALVVTHLDGVPLIDLYARSPLSDADEARVQHQLGAYMAGLHAVRGTRFGYLNAATGLVGDTWPEAFGLMVAALLADARRWGTDVPADRIRAALARHRAALSEVTVPLLVHTDLWAGNLFLDPQSLELVGVIDPERSVWGDPLLDLAGADPTGRGPVPEALVAGYAAAAGDLALGSPSGEARLLLYRLQMALVMTVEIAPRGYTWPGIQEHRTKCEANLTAALDALD